LQALLEDEMRQRQKLEAKHQRMALQLHDERAQREAQAQQLADIMQFLQGLGQHTGFSLPLGLFAPRPPPPLVFHATPVSMQLYCFRLFFACMTSTFCLTHAISSLLCSLNRWVWIIQLMLLQVIKVYLHHSLSGQLGNDGCSYTCICICCSLGDGMVIYLWCTCGFV
jgi:hypothetical protein